VGWGVVSAGGLARKSVGVPSLWFFAVSASAPMTVVAGGIVQTYAATGIVGVALAFLVLALALALLSVGPVAMARHVGSAAPFYTLLARGLGPAAGVAGGLVALVGYNAVQIALYGLLGATLSGLFGGAWWAWAVGCCVLIAALGVVRVDIGASVVGVLAVVEVAVLVGLVAGGLTHPADGFTLDPVRPGNLFVTGVGGVLALSIAAFVGFETTLAFGEEARSGAAIGRATFRTLLLIGPFYALCAWAIVVATGPDAVAQAARDDPNLAITMIAQTGGLVFGPLLASLASMLLITSIFAAMLSFHCTVARYVFALGREHVLPSVLGRTGTGNRSVRDAPIGGSLVQSGIAAAAVTLFAVTGANPITTVFTLLAALAAVAILALLLAASVASIRWFRAGGGANEDRWERVIGPGLAVVAGAVVLGTTVANFGALVGTGQHSPLTLALIGVVGLAVAAGLGWAGVLAAARPQVYRGIGDGKPADLAVADRRLDDVKLWR